MVTCPKLFDKWKKIILGNICIFAIESSQSNIVIITKKINNLLIITVTFTYSHQMSTNCLNTTNLWHCSHIRDGMSEPRGQCQCQWTDWNDLFRIMWLVSGQKQQDIDYILFKFKHRLKLPHYMISCYVLMLQIGKAFY